MNIPMTNGVLAQALGQPAKTTIKHQMQQAQTAKLATNATVGVTVERIKARAFRSKAVSCLTRCCVKNDMACNAA